MSSSEKALHAELQLSTGVTTSPQQKCGLTRMLNTNLVLQSAHRTDHLHQHKARICHRLMQRPHCHAAGAAAEQLRRKGKARHEDGCIGPVRGSLEALVSPSMLLVCTGCASQPKTCQNTSPPREPR